MKIVRIKNEAQAFELLQKAVNHELGDTPLQLVFVNWPIIEVRMQGEGYDSTITADIANAVVEVQRAVNRAYARAVHGTAHSRSLTDSERQDIQFKAQVQPGSSLIKIDLGPFAEKLASAITSNMTPEMLTVTVVGLALVGGGTLLAKQFLKSRSDEKQVEQTTRTQLALSEQESKRLEIVTKAMAQAPQIALARAEFDDARNQILRSAGDAQTLTLNSLQLDGETARRLATANRAESIEVQLNGSYLITAVDLRQQDEIKMRVQRVSDGKEFLASFQDQSLDRSQIGLLQQAEWARSQVYLSINAKILRGEVTVATVVEVKAQPAP